MSGGRTQLPAHTTQQRLPTVDTGIQQDALRPQRKNKPKKLTPFTFLFHTHLEMVF